MMVLKGLIKEEKAFTLIELIIVVLILGVLASLAIPRFTGSMEKAKGDEAIVNLRLIFAGQRMYRLDYNEYADNLDCLTPDYIEDPRGGLYFGYSIPTAPAGAFQAYKIEFTTLLSGTGQVTVGGQELTAQVSTTVTETRWYSDSVKNFVKATSDTTTMVTVIGQTATTKTHAERELTSYSLE